LASTSPRRKALMMHLGLPFKVVASNYREVHQKHLKPEQLVKFLAEGKARAAAKHYRNAIVIGGDTIIVHRGKVYGKPKDKADARRILKMLSGGINYVYTGVCVIILPENKKISRAVKTKMVMRRLNSKEIDYYVFTGEPMDKAGGYGPLGAGQGLIKKIEGDFTNALGLPLDVLQKMLKRFL
jgi:septum formation protein